MAQYSENAASESRESGRQHIQLEEIIGSFEVDSEEVHFESAIVNDVSVSGAGIELPVALTIGSDVGLTFTAGDWRIGVQGTVMWCDELQQPDLSSAELINTYRMGIKFDPSEANNNVVFFMASRSIVRPEAN